MRPGSHAHSPTVFVVVKRAVAICDPDGDDEALAEFALAFEDDDEPVAALDEPDRRFFEVAEARMGDRPDPALCMAAAVATYLAFRRDELSDADDDLLRLAARAEFGDRPPDDVAAWLREMGAGA